jgi:hypothetical protein
LSQAESIWQEGSQWDVYYNYQSTGSGDSTEVGDDMIMTYRLLHADNGYLALEETVTFRGEIVSSHVQGYIRNEADTAIYVRPVLDNGSIGNECLLYDFSKPFEYGDTIRYGVLNGEVMEVFIDWQQDTLDYYMIDNGDMHCLPAWEGIIYQYGYIGGPMDLFLYRAAPGKAKKPKPSNISHVIFSTKGGHKKLLVNGSDDQGDIIIPYDEMLTDGTTWECLAVNNRHPNLNDTYTIQVLGDTLVDNRHCKLVYSPEYDIKRVMFEEGRKVYVINTDNQPELVLNFNLQVGDSIDPVARVIELWDQENMGHHYHTITIDTGIDCTSRFSFDPSPWLYHLIEGIGASKDEFLGHQFINKENTFSYLLKCWKQGSLVYQVAQQDYEYVPFVREGVKWVYFYENPIDMDGFIPWGRHYYTFEMQGEAWIDGKRYTPVHLYSGHGINEDNDTVPVFLREEDKVVYGIIPDDRRYWECPIGIATEVNDVRLLSSIVTGQEFILYDFNNPVDFYRNYQSTGTPYYCPLLDEEGTISTDTILIGSNLRKRFVFQSQYDYWGDYSIIEGIGYAGDSPGMPLNYFYGLTTGMTQVINHLSHVIEDGTIVYKTRWYNPDYNNIDEVDTDKPSRYHDDNFYNLMGQPVGKDMPSVPSIYIHQGKKIVVR